MSAAGVIVSSVKHSGAENSICLLYTSITGSQTEAAMLVNQMKAYDIPATDDNIKAGTDAIDRAKSLTNISNETKAYLVRNNMNPTVSNVYKATYSSSQVQDYRQKTKMTEISDELFEELKPQLKQILEEAHIDSSCLLYTSA